MKPKIAPKQTDNGLEDKLENKAILSQDITQTEARKSIVAKFDSSELKMKDKKLIQETRASLMDKLESNMNKQGATSFMEMHKRANGN